MKFGICAPYRAVAALTDLPFDYLEENVQRFLQPERPQEDFERAWNEARALSVPIEAANSLIPASLPLITTPTQSVDMPQVERYMRTTLRRAEQVGIRIIVFGSGAARMRPADVSSEDTIKQIGEHLQRWGEWAKDAGVQIVLEPLRYEETNTLNTVSEAGALVKRLVQSHIKLLADAYHMAYNQETPQDIVSYGDLLVHVHVAEKRERAAPGRYGEDFRPFFRALKQVHYDQRISIECNWQNFGDEVEPAIKTLREQWEHAG